MTENSNLSETDYKRILEKMMRKKDDMENICFTDQGLCGHVGYLQNRMTKKEI